MACSGIFVPVGEPYVGIYRERTRLGTGRLRPGQLLPVRAGREWVPSRPTDEAPSVVPSWRYLRPSARYLGGSQTCKAINAGRNPAQPSAACVITAEKSTAPKNLSLETMSRLLCNVGQSRRPGAAPGLLRRRSQLPA
jgi:hypothetical protein